MLQILYSNALTINIFYSKYNKTFTKNTFINYFRKTFSVVLHNLPNACSKEVSGFCSARMSSKVWFSIACLITKDLTIIVGQNFS